MIFLESTVVPLIVGYLLGGVRGNFDVFALLLVDTICTVSLPLCRCRVEIGVYAEANATVSARNISCIPMLMISRLAKQSNK